MNWISLEQGQWLGTGVLRLDSNVGPRRSRLASRRMVLILSFKIGVSWRDDGMNHA